MAARHPYPPMPYPTDPFGIYAFMARIDARLDRIENQMEATGLSLGYLVTRIDEIEERLESIEDNNQGIENKIIDMDSRFDDIDSKLEDIDMEALTEGIDGVVRESLEELNLDAVERMAAINHNTNIYRAIRDAGNPDLWGDIILVEVPFPGGEKPTSRALPLLKNPEVINNLNDTKLTIYYRGYYPRKAVPESRDKRIKAIWKAIGWKLV